MKYRLKALNGSTLRTGSKPEAAAIQRLTDEGWMVYKRGWPDLMAVKDGRVRLLVVCAPGGGLRKQQKELAAGLALMCLEVEIFRAPDVPHGKGQGNLKEGMGHGS